MFYKLDDIVSNKKKNNQWKLFRAFTDERDIFIFILCQCRLLENAGKPTDIMDISKTSLIDF